MVLTGWGLVPAGSVSPAGVELGHGPDPLLEVLQGDPLVGRMHVGPGRCESHEENRGLQDLLEVHHDGDGSALSCEDRGSSESLLEGCFGPPRRSRPSSSAFQGRPPWSSSTVTSTSGGATSGQMGPQQLCRPVWDPGWGRGGSSPWPWHGPAEPFLPPRRCSR